MSWKVSTNRQTIILEHGDTCGITIDVEGFGTCVFMVVATPESADVSLRLPGGIVFGLKEYAGLEIREAMDMTFQEVGTFLYDTMTGMFKIEAV